MKSILQSLSTTYTVMATLAAASGWAVVAWVAINPDPPAPSDWQYYLSVTDQVMEVGSQLDNRWEELQDKVNQITATAGMIEHKIDIVCPIEKGKK